MTTEKEKNGVQGVPAHRPNLFLGDFGKSEGSTSLQINIVGERQGCQCSQRRADEKVGCGSICTSKLQRKIDGLRFKNTYFPGTEEDLQQLHVRFQVAMVHRIATCALELRHLVNNQNQLKGKGNLQHDSQQLEILPIETKKCVQQDGSEDAWGVSDSNTHFKLRLT